MMVEMNLSATSRFTEFKWKVGGMVHITEKGGGGRALCGGNVYLGVVWHGDRLPIAEDDHRCRKCRKKAE